jgi:N-acylneuraminate cytidylyltransferase
MHHRRLAVIPARGGSKRVPRKNVRDFFGRPMIAHTITAARESNLFDRVIVSTDDEEIATISEECGAEVPFRRPDHLADDHTPVSRATAHALEQVDPNGCRYDDVVQLMANCPLRTAEDIYNSYLHFRRRDHNSQVSVFRFGWQNPWWALRMQDDGQLTPLFEAFSNEEVRSQDQPPLYCISGAVWWAKSKILRQHQSFLVDDRAGWIIPWQRGIDIDTNEDWRFAEVLVQTRTSSLQEA